MASQDKKSIDELWASVGMTRPRLNQGFATKSSEFAREMGRKGGKKAHDKTQVVKTAHQFTSAEAKAAAAKGLKNRWDKYRAERAEAEAAFIEAMRNKVASSPEEATTAPRMSKAEYEEVMREGARIRKQTTVGKGVSSVLKSLVDRVFGGRDEARVAELEKELVPEARAVAAEVDVAHELANLDKSLDQQIAEVKQQMNPRERLAAARAAKMEKLRKEQEKK